MRYPRHQKMKISIKNVSIHFFIEIFIFGCCGYLIIMKCGYGLYAELKYETNKSTNSKFGSTNKEICQKYNKKSIFLFFPPFVYTNFTLMVDIIILNPIGSYKVNFNGTIFVLRAIFLP